MTEIKAVIRVEYIEFEHRVDTLLIARFGTFGFL